MKWEQVTTLKRGAGPPETGKRELVALTIACHPDPRRLGERALLPELAAGSPVPISRAEPSFAAPDAVWGRPLEDPFLSRGPFLLKPRRSGEIVLDPAASPTRLVVDGLPVETERLLSAEETGAGVVMELGERVVLLLHRLPEPKPSPAGTRLEDGMVGASGPMTELRALIGRVADLEVPVLLRGDSGTGKELAARALHRRSQRAEGPFVAVNLGALPPSLAAAELFGNVKGAFTGAVRSQAGYFRAAQGGTLFLDEVGETPPEVQAMLLRTLETGEVFPVGSQRAHRVDARLIAATDADLETRIQDGSFKEPLLHRLSAYEIWLPPLRQRRDDISRLFLHFAARELAAVGEEELLRHPGPGEPWLPAGLAARLLRYSWPGNVRQLHNVVRQLVIDSRGQEQLVVGPRVERLLAEADEGAQPEASGSRAGDEPPARRRPAEIGTPELETVLRAHRFEPAAAARALGISRPSIYYLIRQHPRLKTAQDLDAKEIRQALDACDGNIGAAAEQLEVSARALRRRLGISKSKEIDSKTLE